MAYFSYKNLWESECDSIVSRRDKLQDLNNNPLELEVNETYKKDEKITTNFEPTDDQDVINKAHLNENLVKINGQLLKLKKRLQRI